MQEPLWQLVSRHVALKRSGHWYIGLCPFHQDVNPSFTVGDFTYQCFGCGVKGNRKAWMEFIGHSTIKSQPVRPTVNDKKHVLENRQDWIGHSYAIKYFASRGVTRESVIKFKLGYNGWRFTIPCYDKDTLVGVKLRIDPNNHNDRGPKYVALPGSKRAIFNFDILRSANEVIICEGELDCIILDQLGLPAVTSTAGCRSFDMKWLRFFENKEVFLLLDNDQAGRLAQESLHQNLLWWGAKYHIVPKLIQSTEYKDVNEWWLARRSREAGITGR